MPRKRRPVHADRVYHVFNRGNYRQPIFRDPGAIEAFLKALNETLELFTWEVYAYAIMPNHYHLCLLAPAGDISDGMQRLLTSFCVRFNRYREESGHVFQGRFKCTVAPKGMSVRRIIDYIHLNPIRAKKKTLRALERSNVTSLSAYLNPALRGRLAVAKAFGRYVGFEDTPAGRKSYLSALSVTAGEDPDGNKFEDDWRGLQQLEKLERRRAPAALVPKHALSREAVQANRRERWASEALRLADAMDLDLTEMAILSKRDPRKLELARQLYRDVGAPASWICSRLSMGRPSNLHMLLAKGVRLLKDDK
jgi:putative transposase